MTLKLVFHAEVKDSEDIRGICEQIGMCFEELGDVRLISVAPVKGSEPMKVGRGPYKNVMLSDVGVRELEKMFGAARIEARIADLSYKLYQKNYRYSDHFAVIVEWEEKERGKTPAAAGYTSSVAYGDSFPSRGSLSGGDGTQVRAASFDVDEFFKAAVKKGVGE